MRLPAVAILVLASCSTAQMVSHEDAPSGVDGRLIDGGAVDAAAPDASGIDATAPDAAARDAASADAGATDAASADAAATDAPAPIDAGAADAAIDAPGCAIAGAAAITLDGVGDLAAYPAAQTVPIGAGFDGADAVRLSWSPTALYLTVHSGAFADGAKPYHLYVQAGTALPAGTPSTGKEYGGLTAALPFTATHLIAIRRTNDFGSGAYDGVYLPAGTPAWTTLATALTPGTDVFIAADNAELSVRVPWAALGGCPTQLRVAGHIVNGGAGTEWKTLVPAAHTPWMTPGGAAYTLDLTGPAAVSGWSM